MVKQVGRLNRRVELQQQEPEFDALGRQVRKQWVTIAKLWAEVRDTSGSEAEQAKQISAGASVVVVIRGRGGMNTQQRFLFRGRVLEIKAIVDPDNSGREFTVYCGENK